jgi:hypothetical protein
MKIVSALIGVAAATLAAATAQATTSTADPAQPALAGAHPVLSASEAVKTVVGGKVETFQMARPTVRGPISYKKGNFYYQFFAKSSALPVEDRNVADAGHLDIRQAFDQFKQS